MNHDPAPEVTARGWRGALQRFARWRHFREWEYGTCSGSFPVARARRNRSSGEVQFVMWSKGTVHKERTWYLAGIAFTGDYTYHADWWHNYNSFWWPNFKPDKS